MAENVINISTVLKRKLKDGKEYSKLIPRVSCKTTPLGDGDTFFTVDRMQDWIEKFRHQTAKLALRLEGRTVEETVNNIYNFLYNHIQYTADGPLQQLRSPACTWMQRKQGTDCKSYSVFASCILSNLGIKHAIRQVRQSYFYPEEFTHVYVVVPKDQSKENYDNAPTFVLDATKHENTEVNYLEKVDLYMNNLKHVGLNAPQDERTSRIVANFEKFCNHCSKKGIPISVINSIRERVSQFTSQGKDPKFKIVDQGIEIEGKLFPLKFNDDHLHENNQGLGFAVTTAVAGVTAGKKLLALLPSDFIGDTFGAVMANGFDLGCWNSAYNESKAKEDISKTIQPFFQSCFDKIEAGKEIEKYLNLAIECAYKFSYLYNKISKATKYAECSRKGWALTGAFADGMIANISTLLENMNSQYTYQKRNVTTPEAFTIPGNMTTDGKPFSIEGPNPVTYPQISNIQSKGFFGGGGVKTDPTSPTNNYQPTGGQQQNVNGSGNQQKSGDSNTGLIIGGVALAALPLFFMMKKGSIAANTPARKAPAKKAKK